jgi:hypothetical protein
MKYSVLTVVLLLMSCNNSTTTPKVAEPQREALDKAKGVDQVINRSAEETKNKVDDADR